MVYIIGNNFFLSADYAEKSRKKPPKMPEKDYKKVTYP